MKFEPKEEPVIEPGCLACGATIPERRAKMRAKVCSEFCAKALLTARRKGLLRATPLYCQACREELEPKLCAKGAVVCGNRCRSELRRYRWHVLKGQKCPHCLHPSTPAEWEEYRQWRASRGPLQQFMRQEGRGNLVWKREKQMRIALRDCLEVLRSYRDEILLGECSEFMEGLPVRSSLCQEAAVTIEPVERSIAEIEALLSEPKRMVDTKTEA